MAQKKKQDSNQLTFTHLIVTALVMLVVGYLFGRFSVGVPGVSGAGGFLPPSASGLSNGAEIAALQRAAENSPESASAWAALGNAFFDADRNADAIQAYTRSLEIDGRDPNVWTDRGVMYRRLGDPTQAIKDFDTAATLDSTHAQSRFNKGIVLYYDLNSKAAARASFEQVLEMYPNFVTPSGARLADFMKTLE